MSRNERCHDDRHDAGVDEMSDTTPDNLEVYITEVMLPRREKTCDCDVQPCVLHDTDYSMIHDLIDLVQRLRDRLQQMEQERDDLKLAHAIVIEANDNQTKSLADSAPVALPPPSPPRRHDGC